MPLCGYEGCDNGASYGTNLDGKTAEHGRNPEENG